jgi:predicted dehydrogenase
MTIRVGVIGLDYGAQVHVPAFKENLKYDVAAVCSRAPGRAEAFAREHHIPHWYTDARQLVASDLDLVSIATPPHTHAGYAAMALARRKHIVVETAFVPSVADARVLIDLTRSVKKVGAAAFVLRYKPHLRMVSDLLAQNKIGAPRLMRFEFFSNFLVLPDEHNQWMWDGANGGGILANYGSHAIDLALRWFGPVREVEGALTALSSAAPSDRERLADDTGNVTLLFESGLLATLTFSAVTAVPRTSMELHGTDGSLLLSGFGDDVAFVGMGAEDSESLFPPMEYLEETRGQSGLSGAFSSFLDDLARAIQDDAASPLLPTLADGLAVTRVLEAVQLAARERRRVALSDV